MNNFSHYITNAPKLSDILTNYRSYRAHLHPEKDSESLYEHVNLVNHYANELVLAHGLDHVINSLITDLTESWGDNKVNDILKLFFTNSIVFHDFGKINENFQVDRMQNKSFKNVSIGSFKPTYGHSFLGAFIFLSYHVDLLDNESLSNDQKVKLVYCCFFFSYNILQHHSPILGNLTEPDELFNRFKDVLAELKIYIDTYGLKNLNEKWINSILNHAEKLWRTQVVNEKFTTDFSLFALIKLNFSVLTAADYLATHEYMNGKQGEEARTTDFGTFSERSRIENIYQHQTTYKHNKEVYESLANHKFAFPTSSSFKNLNFLRKQMAIEVVHSVKENVHNHLFYLEAPTGGGKTNLASLVIVELMLADARIKKVNYVFPFTTLSTQTYPVLKNSMGLDQSEIVELHSKASLASKTEEVQDGNYGNEKKDFIDHLFSLYPVTLMSHVKFFDILKTNRKESNYLLHRLANSIVVIDEIQSYNPNIWDKMLFFIERYAKHFNIRFIVMSATLPKISNLKVGFSTKISFVDLLPEPQRYIQNINFSGRVSFNYELLELGKIELPTLQKKVLEKSQAYLKKNGSVKTIVEFIYKKSASAFAKLFEHDNFFDKIFILSGTILEARRREIINFIKRSSKEPINILLICTQVVEAGVDIDMDLGFKNTSLLDSDEQLAGRVNRNSSKEQSEVYLFHLDNPNVLYGKDVRYKKTLELSIPERQSILSNKNFKMLYEKVLLAIDDSNHLDFKDSINGYKRHFHRLSYRDIDKEFQIIDQDNKTVFVPLAMPITVSGTNAISQNEIFTTKELLFLNQYEIVPKTYGEDSIATIDGAEVWNLYRTQIEKQAASRTSNKGFNIQTKVDFRILQSIMSKFCFSLISQSKDYKELQIFGQEAYGFFYFAHYAEIREKGAPYDFVTGLNTDAFSDSNFI